MLFSSSIDLLCLRAFYKFCVLVFRVLVNVCGLCFIKLELKLPNMVLIEEADVR